MNRTSYMEPPLWLRVCNSGNTKSPSRGTNIRSIDKIETFVYLNGKIYRMESLAKTYIITGHKVSGKNFQSFKSKGYHKFHKMDCFLYVSTKYLPVELLKKIELLEVENDLLIR